MHSEKGEKVLSSDNRKIGSEMYGSKWQLPRKREALSFDTS